MTENILKNFEFLGVRDGWQDIGVLFPRVIRRTWFNSDTGLACALLGCVRRNPGKPQRFSSHLIRFRRCRPNPGPGRGACFVGSRASPRLERIGVVPTTKFWRSFDFAPGRGTIVLCTHVARLRPCMIGGLCFGCLVVP